MIKLNILIAGGGTGGHIFPGIALYEEFKKSGINAALLVGRRDLGFFPVLTIGSDNVFYYYAYQYNKNFLKLIPFFIKFIISVFKIMMLLKRQKINAVIGMGGFVSAPALASAYILKKPVFLCEQNTIPGRVNVFFAKKAKKIFTSFKITTRYFRKDMEKKILYSGNPLRELVLSRLTKNAARKSYNLVHCKKILMVIGNSPGARQINELFLEILKIFENELMDTGIIWITGNSSFEKYRDTVNDWNGGSSVFLSPFMENIGASYRASDLVLSMAGAGSIMEFAAAGLPSVLIPYPYAAGNHQEKNAEVYARAGAAVVIKKEEAVPEKAGGIIIDILNNPIQLSRMAENARSMAKINAAGDIVKNVTGELSGNNIPVI